MTKLRIFLADDHAIVREGLKALINSQPDMEVVGEASDGYSALTRVRASSPDIAVLDVSMPGLGGAEVAARLKQESPLVKVLALTVHEDLSYLRALLAAGASGYVLKQAAAAELVSALRAVAGGGTYVDPRLAEKMVNGFLGKSSRVSSEHEEALSGREREVLERIAQGYTNKEIASQLSLSVKSVETYKARSLEKLGLSSRAELVRYALRHGWLKEGNPHA